MSAAGIEARDDFLDAAAEEVLQHGFAGVALTSIAGRLGVSRSAVLRRFPDTTSILQALSLASLELIDDCIASGRQASTSAGMERLSGFLTTLSRRTSYEAVPAATIALLTDGPARSSPAHLGSGPWHAALIGCLTDAVYDTIPDGPDEERARRIMTGVIGMCRYYARYSGEEHSPWPIDPVMAIAALDERPIE